MATSINVSSDRGVKRKFDSIDIEDLANSELGKKQQHARLGLLYSKVMNITKTKMVRISNAELVLHRYVLLNQTLKEMNVVLCETENNIINS